MIGNLLEEVMRPGLQAFCAPRGLYLDFRVIGRESGVAGRSDGPTAMETSTTLTS